MVDENMNVEQHISEMIHLLNILNVLSGRVVFKPLV